MTKELNDKAIDIKGKKYVLVSDRVLYFNETYPNWSITTERISEGDMEIIKATVIPDVANPERKFTWYSQATWWEWFINKTAALENAETSACWRALAFLWIGVIDSIASADEMKKAWADGRNISWQAKKTNSHTDDKGNPNWWFQKAISNTEYMKKCLDEEDFIRNIKDKYTLDDTVEAQLREAYQNSVVKVNEPITDLPFN